MGRAGRSAQVVYVRIGEIGPLLKEYSQPPGRKIILKAGQVVKTEAIENDQHNQSWPIGVYLSAGNGA